MADDSANPAVEAAAANAAAATATEIAAVQAGADAAIEHAQEQVQAAQDTAQQIADAAVQTELGRQVTDACNRVTQCQSAMETLVTTTAESLSSMNRRLEEMAEKLLSTQAPPTVAIVQPSSTPELSGIIPTPPPEVMPPAVAIVNPAENAGVPLAAVTAVPKRVRRLI